MTTKTKTDFRDMLTLCLAASNAAFATWPPGNIVHVRVVEHSNFRAHRMKSCRCLFSVLLNVLKNVINLKFPPQPHQKYNTTQYMKNLAFDIAHSDKRWLYYQFSLYLTCTFYLQKVGIMYFWGLGVKVDPFTPKFKKNIIPAFLKRNV